MKGFGWKVHSPQGSVCPNKIVYTLAPKYLYRECFKAQAFALWVHGPFRVQGFMAVSVGLKVGLSDEGRTWGSVVVAGALEL